MLSYKKGSSGGQRRNVYKRGIVTICGKRSFSFWWIVRKFFAKILPAFLDAFWQGLILGGFKGILLRKEGGQGQTGPIFLPLTNPRSSGITYKVIQIVGIQSVKAHYTVCIWPFSIAILFFQITIQQILFREAFSL